MKNDVAKRWSVSGKGDEKNDGDIPGPTKRSTMPSNAGDNSDSPRWNKKWHPDKANTFFCPSQTS